MVAARSLSKRKAAHLGPSDVVAHVGPSDVVAHVRDPSKAARSSYPWIPLLALVAAILLNIVATLVRVQTATMKTSVPLIQTWQFYTIYSSLLPLLLLCCYASSMLDAVFNGDMRLPPAQVANTFLMFVIAVGHTLFVWQASPVHHGNVTWYWASWLLLSVLCPFLFHWFFMLPVPAGTSLPTMTFSFKPFNGSTLPLIAASVKTLVVS